MIRNACLALVLVAVAGAACDPTEPSHQLAVTSESLDGRPFGVAVAAGDKALISRLDAGSVARYQVGPGHLEVDIAVGTFPTDVAVSPSGSVAFVTNQGHASVGFIDVAAGTQTSEVAVGGDTFRVIADPAGARLYVSTNTSRLYVLDIATRTVTDSITVPVDVNGLAISSDGTTLFAASPTTGQLVRIDLQSRQITATVAVPNGPQDIVLSPAGDEIWVAGLGGPVEIRRAANLAPLGTVAASDGGFGMALSPGGSWLYVTLPLSGRIVVIDRSKRVVTEVLETGGVPRRIRFARGGEVAVAADESGRVLFIR